MDGRKDLTQRYPKNGFVLASSLSRPEETDNGSSEISQSNSFVLASSSKTSLSSPKKFKDDNIDNAALINQNDSNCVGSSEVKTSNTNSLYFPKKKRRKVEQKNKIHNYFSTCMPSCSKNETQLEDTGSISWKKERKDKIKVLCIKKMSTSNSPSKLKKFSQKKISKGKVENQSDKINYFQYLEVDIVENIFSLLPFNDLMYNSTRVCHQWKEIIYQPNFLSWKKEYYRLKLNFHGYVKESRIAKFFCDQDRNNCLPHLLKSISAMCHKPAVDMLDCLKRHPKYAWVIELLRERFTELISDTINPWAVVACLIILSEKLVDVWNIILLLTFKDSESKISHVLDGIYFIATALLYLKLDIHINSGLHYRTYYALYLYENLQKINVQDLTLFKESLSGQQSMYKYGDVNNLKLSHEQVQIINHEMNKDDVMKIVAFAGTGKTTTLVRYTQMRPNFKFLLIVFNKSVCEHAKLVFNSNVTCRTAHSLAFGAIGKKYVHKLSSKLRPIHIVKFLEAGKITLNIIKRASVVLNILEKFMCSAQTQITLELVPEVILDKECNILLTPTQQDKAILVEDANHLWSKMINPKDSSIKITHDTYLKLYQLSKPDLSQYNCIVVDEAQDCNVAILDIIQNQRCPKILVGDPNQQIYSFRGAENSLKSVCATRTFYLTQSFRFGPEIGYIASCCLEVLKENHTKTLVGGLKKDQCNGESVGQVAIIARSNAVLFDEAVRICCLNKDTKVKAAFAGGITGYGFDQILDIYRLKMADLYGSDFVDCIKDKFISRFSSFSSLKKYADNSDDAELIIKIQIVIKYEENLENYISCIKEKAFHNLQNADIVFSTAHKSKGLEFDTVCLTDDYSIGLLPYSGNLQQKQNDEFNILYVAVTRAKKSLIMSPAVYFVLLASQEKFEYLVRKSTDELNEDACCHCSVVISTQSCLQLNKRKTTLYCDKQLKSGFVCSSCATLPFVTPEVRHPILSNSAPLADYGHEAMEKFLGSNCGEQGRRPLPLIFNAADGDLDFLSDSEEDDLNIMLQILE